jgi:signal recognition particle receptor subunit beta
MVSINYSAREVCCKIVYYGPGLSGKTTNLQYVHGKVPTSTRGDLISLATEADRTLYFDFLPINIGTINGFQAKFQLYTVPGQVYYNATRKLVLRGVDGVVFVADSQPDKMDENVESLANLVDNLLEYGYDINELPMVLQYNKRDLPNVLTVDEMNNRLNTRELPHFEASATQGAGVFDTLKFIIKLVLEKAKSTAVNNKPAAAAASMPTSNQAEPAREPVAESEPMAQAHYSETKFAQSGRISAQSSQGIATHPAQNPIQKPEPERFSSFRPYPGSNASGSIRTGGASTPDLNSPIPTIPRPQTPTLNRPGINTGAQPAQSSGITPTMAPSLKRRGVAKKRGIFKRLFGIK